ncbi:uncharacterized protein LOC132196582 [Neocloeon triangulifer]|uniref:uncharacterized protein LOC132196582 n=1 Tax=Neocloeon triangulifer TaxID=2078957 RepID=UPI00286F09EF|nr:uncharacterized protein LOC132196582 [Neocloeon triangulifer]
MENNKFFILEQVKNLLTSQPTNLNEKCFIKCYGEGTGVFVNGKLVEELIYAQMSLISKNDIDKLMESYAVMDTCSNTTRGMDPCDKAAELFKCGKENSPEAITALMNNLEASMMEISIPLPPTSAVCPNNFNCVTDDVLKMSFDSKLHDEFLNTTKGNALVKILCNKKYLVVVFKSQITFAKAMEYCCSFGLRLATIDTKTEHDCLLANNITAFADGLYAVAASMLGQMGKPAWCFSSAPFNVTWGSELLTVETDLTKFTVNMRFQPPRSTAAAYFDMIPRAICQSV